MVESTSLLKMRSLNSYRGFESLPHRHSSPRGSDEECSWLLDELGLSDPYEWRADLGLFEEVCFGCSRLFRMVVANLRLNRCGDEYCSSGFAVELRAVDSSRAWVLLPFPTWLEFRALYV